MLLHWISSNANLILKLQTVDDTVDDVGVTVMRLEVTLSDHLVRSDDDGGDT